MEYDFVKIRNAEGKLMFTMYGNSMYPVLKNGDIGVVETCDGKRLKKGDIVVFRDRKKVVAHRLKRKWYKYNKWWFMAQGDKNYKHDPSFAEEDLYGRVICFRKGKRMKSPYTFRFRVSYFFSAHLPKMVIPYHNNMIRIKNQVERLRKGMRSLKNNMAIVCEHSKKRMQYNIFIAMMEGAIPLFIICCIKMLIDALTAPTGKTSLSLPPAILLITTGLAFLANAMMPGVKSLCFDNLSRSVTRHIYNLMHRKHAALHISIYENPTLQDKIHRAVQEAAFRPVKIVKELLCFTKAATSALIIAVLFLSIHWYLIAMLIIAVMPGVWVKLRFSDKRYRQKEMQSTKEREMHYYSRIITGFPFAKELRLFGFARFFLQLFSKVQETIFKEKKELGRKEFLSNMACQVFAVAVVFLVLGYVTWLKMKGAISIGTVALFFFVMQRGYSTINELFGSITRIMEDNVFLSNFTDFLQMKQQPPLTQKQDFPLPLKKAITVEKLSFRYETSSRDALKEVSMVIPAGKTTAFVGENGSGKSTMMKLLCGFYTPDKGGISFDGVNAQEMGQNTICENISAVFQDFALYNIPALENIALGNIDLPMEAEKVRNAAKEAGIAEMLDELPHQYGTLLGNRFMGGEELSFGQWQKIAIARAFYRDAPLLFLDEPSGALDAISEYRLIESIKKLAEGKTVVIVSHRLSTIRWADMIHVFDGGRVVESGSHEELMSTKGKYYELFKIAERSY